MNTPTPHSSFKNTNYEHAHFAPPHWADKWFRLGNWVGLWTLYKKEVLRFMRVAPQTILAPVISNLLFMTVFMLVFAERTNASPDTMSAFLTFLAPGLIMMGIINNASTNASSSLMTGKLMGSIVDVLMPPLSHIELALGYISGAITRGVVVAISTWATLFFFTTLIPTHIWAIFYFGISGALFMSMIGVLSGIWAEKFDQLTVVQQFIIMPLSFLSGTFYHIDILPDSIRVISLYNPLFYFIDGFRYGFLGIADSNLHLGVLYTICLNITLLLITLRVLKSGWRLKN